MEDLASVAPETELVTHLGEKMGPRQSMEHLRVEMIDFVSCSKIIGQFPRGEWGEPFLPLWEVGTAQTPPPPRYSTCFERVSLIENVSRATWFSIYDEALDLQ